ncbi:hypothetical protein BpHYR1_002747 [Brachionus plicatilis]|uniref:Uncharacterized protein n=1 Tax=Brachionus plicatilis TaxID=10195 RepID=A0A3M7PG58_BRAPC|nr:hypothetical protein BpHYR1_002747 [Brachionus plicatilis]
MIAARFTPQTDASNRSFASNTFSKRSFINESSTARRAKQLLVSNQNSLNNLLNEPLIKSNSNAKNSPINENIFIKKPFKHYVKKPSKSKEISSLQEPVLRPSSSLLLKTAQDVNQFVSIFDKNTQLTASFVNSRTPVRRPLAYSRYSGLRPLNLTFKQGPTIQNCIGIIREPKTQNSEQIKEIYRIKMKQLEQKKIMDEYLELNREKETDSARKTPRSVF